MSTYKRCFIATKIWVHIYVIVSVMGLSLGIVYSLGHQVCVEGSQVIFALLDWLVILINSPVARGIVCANKLIASFTQYFT